MKKSDEQEQKCRKELMKGLPPINLGALFMPPIWGPANGIWITILYYPCLLYTSYRSAANLLAMLASVLSSITLRTPEAVDEAELVLRPGRYSAM